MTERISVSFGITNTVNYNSVRLDVSYEDDVREGETLEEAYERAWTTVDDQIASKVEEKV